MPEALVMDKVSSSPAEMVLEMVGGILNAPKMDIHEKLAQLRELCLERITFDSPEQAVKIISELADIISSDDSPEVRVAALEAMERMIALEEKAEAVPGAPSVNWKTINIMLRSAKQKTALDTVAVAARAGAPSPESPTHQLLDKKSKLQEASKAEPKTEKNRSKEDALFALQEKAVEAIKQAKVPVTPPPADMLSSEPLAIDSSEEVTSAIAAERPQAATARVVATEEKAEPPIMKFLRSVADTEDEDHIRELANRIISKIENLTVPQPAAHAAPALTEG